MLTVDKVTSQIWVLCMNLAAEVKQEEEKWKSSRIYLL